MKIPSGRFNSTPYEHDVVWNSLSHLTAVDVEAKSTVTTNWRANLCLKLFSEVSQMHRPQQKSRLAAKGGIHLIGKSKRRIYR